MDPHELGQIAPVWKPQGSNKVFKKCCVAKEELEEILFDTTKDAGKEVAIKFKQIFNVIRTFLQLILSFDNFELSETSHLLTPQSDMDSGSSEEFYQAVHHAEQTFRKMESYLKQQQLCDVILIVGNRKIPAHRLVLSSVSDYFAAMFTSDVCEAKQEEIKMEGIDPNALWDLVQFAYTDNRW
ncbi:hypothetical protein MJG53_009934 [Ovis ammon polii x Ovis aries]|uniref:Uncharacterized protein n=1 Tax=Ovis ammon polii x Ovis aries TaxID=2918886 RepID=A0ACB9UV69_9CETA|nr:hypothetical protein MJG53_009934 [Ovis ammon polii x Ovis aries]